MHDAPLPVYVINLDRSRDRWDRVSGPLAAAFGARNVVRVSAVDARTMTDADLRVDPRVHDRLRDQLLRGEQRRYTNEIDSKGAIGCSLSHMECWRRILASGAPGIVAEDDLNPDQLTPELRALVHHAAAAKLGDVVLFGWSNMDGEPVHTATVDGRKLRDVRWFEGTHFYMVTPEGARKLLNRALPVDTHVDHYIARESRLGRVHVVAFEDNLVRQTGDSSLIGHGVVVYAYDNFWSIATILGILAVVALGVVVYVWHYRPNCAAPPPVPPPAAAAPPSAAVALG